MPLFDANSLDHKDRFSRDLPGIAELVLQIQEMKKTVESHRLDTTKHPAARAFLQAALDDLDRAAHKMHQASTL